MNVESATREDVAITSFFSDSGLELAISVKRLRLPSAWNFCPDGMRWAVLL